MPIFALSDDLYFPDPELAAEDGLLAVGGDLSPERLLLAYGAGIFPWHEYEGAPLWWSPDPRCVLFPDRLKISAKLRKVLTRHDYEVTFDQRFPDVIRACASVPRKGQEGTWITGEFQRAYTALHRSGQAHSVEILMDGELAGGLYGVLLGGVFSGESMFSRRPDASKLALCHLVPWLRERGVAIIDCQVTNPYLLSMGAEEIPRREFLKHLRTGRNPERTKT